MAKPTYLTYGDFLESLVPDDSFVDEATYLTYGDFLESLVPDDSFVNKATYLTFEDFFKDSVPDDSFRVARRITLLSCYLGEPGYSNELLLKRGYTQEEIDNAEPMRQVEKEQSAAHVGIW